MQKIILLLIILMLGKIAIAQNSFEEKEVEKAVQMFLPEIFEDLPNVRDFALSKNGTEIYFTIESYKKEYSFIAYITKIGNKWSKPKMASFSGKYKDLEPFFSPDGLTLFFVTNRISNSSEEIKKDMDIWYVTRKSLHEDWSKPINVGNVINTNKNEYYPSVTKNGDLFFTAEYNNSKGKEDIYVSRIVKGKYTTPVSLGKGVNSDKYEFNAFVDPEESFIIFTSYGRKDDIGRGDLYISKKKNNKWSPAIRLHKNINSKNLDYCPFVDVNTNMLYFTTTKSSVKKSFSERKSIEEVMKAFKKQANGLSRVYVTHINKN